MVKEHFLAELGQKLSIQDELLEAIEQAEGEITEAISQAVSHNTADIKETVDLCASIQEKFEMNAEFYKAKAKEYKAMAERYEDQLGRMKELLTRVMSGNERSLLSGHSKSYKLTTRNDFVVEIDEPDLVPIEFKISQTTHTPSKTLIKSHIVDLGLDWQEVQIQGVRLRQSYALSKPKDIVRKLK